MSSPESCTLTAGGKLAVCPVDFCCALEATRLVRRAEQLPAELRLHNFAPQTQLSSKVVTKCADGVRRRA